MNAGTPMTAHAHSAQLDFCFSCLQAEMEEHVMCHDLKNRAVLETYLEGDLGGCLGSRVSALLVHRQAPAGVVQVEHAGSLVQRPPQALERQLAIRCVDADDPPGTPKGTPFSNPHSACFSTMHLSSPRRMSASSPSAVRILMTHLSAAVSLKSLHVESLCQGQAQN